MRALKAAPPASTWSRRSQPPLSPTARPGRCTGPASSQLDRNLLESTLLALIVAFIARPLAAAAATAFEPFSARDRLLLGWTGLRGAVPVVLATFPVIEGIPRSLEFFNVALFAVLVSTLIQGSTVETLANRLGCTEKAAVAN